MKILLLNEFQNPVVQNLIHFFSSKLGMNNFNWTGKRWYREDFLPLTELEEYSYLPEPSALTKLNNGYYDYVIFSDSSTYIYLSSHLKQHTKRIFIDSTDSYIIPRFYLENCDFYFKCQFKKPLIIANQNELKNPIILDQHNKIFPFCLTPSFKVIKDYYQGPNDVKNFDIFFNGSAWPKDRIKAIALLKQNTEINFFGGLYNRKDLEFNNIVPDILRSKPFPLSTLIHCINSSKINLSLKGNGNNCYRQFEILYLGGFLLNQKHQSTFGHKEPEDGKHCAFFKEDFSNFIDIIKYYLSNINEINHIAKNGKDFFEKNYHPSVLVNYILNIIQEK